MRIETTRLEIATDDGISVADVTHEVNQFIRATGILEGLCVMMVARQECFLSLAPDLDDAFDDLMRMIREADDARLRRRPGHITADRADTELAGNAPPGFLAESISFPIREGGPDLGSWEAIVLVDAEGPARRAIELTVMGPAPASVKT